MLMLAHEMLVLSAWMLLVVVSVLLLDHPLLLMVLQLLLVLVEVLMMDHPLPLMVLQLMLVLAQAWMPLVCVAEACQRAAQGCLRRAGGTGGAAPACAEPYLEGCH